MRADDLLEIKVKPYPYGPSIHPGPLASELIKRYPKAMDRWDKTLEFLATEVSNKSVAELERIATALYIARTEGKSGDEGCHRLHEVKPHIPIQQAHEAFNEVSRLEELMALKGAN